ncbi:MAG: tyrosine-type recombinase/integrase [Candidatus Bathyarchaeia archaeon]|jgi:integrase/recombinase XerD
MSLDNNVESVSSINEARLAEGFLKDCELRRLSPETIEGYKSSLRITSQILRKQGLSLSKLDKESLKRVLEFLVDQGYVCNTLLNYFATLSGFCDYLVWEGIADTNPVVPFRKRYVRQFKNQHDPERKLISVDEMAMLINSILDPRDKAIVTLLAKTGIRRGELIGIDIKDIDWVNQSIQLKPRPKRSNCTVFFDDETARVLRRWLSARRDFNVQQGCEAVFVNEGGTRLQRHGVTDAVTKHAERVGLHNPMSKRIEDHFTPHCCRHWFTTHLRRNGMRRELIQELRGDARNAAVDIYDHIDKKELRRAYLAAIPVLGIN